MSNGLDGLNSSGGESRASDNNHAGSANDNDPNDLSNDFLQNLHSLNAWTSTVFHNMADSPASVPPTPADLTAYLSGPGGTPLSSQLVSTSTPILASTSSSAPGPAAQSQAPPQALAQAPCFFPAPPPPPSFQDADNFASGLYQLFSAPPVPSPFHAQAPADYFSPAVSTLSGGHSTPAEIELTDSATGPPQLTRSASTASIGQALARSREASARGPSVGPSNPTSASASTSNGATPVEHEDDKRKRNTEASARFRAKKKEKNEQLQSETVQLRERVHNLEKDADKLRAENRLLRSIIQEQTRGVGRSGESST